MNQYWGAQAVLAKYFECIGVRSQSLIHERNRCPKVPWLWTLKRKKGTIMAIQRDIRQMNTNEEESIRLSLRFSKTLLLKIDAVRQEWGLRSRSATVERLLQELFKD